MSYLVGRDGRLKEQIHFVGMAGYKPKRTGKSLGMGGIFGGRSSLGSVGGESLSFAEGAALARAALVALAAAGATLERTATSASQQNIGTEVKDFATGGAWRGLNRAVENLDVNKLRSLQDQVKNISALAASELRDSLITRFFLVFINPPAALMPPEQAEAIRAVVETPPPGFPDVGKGMPWYFWAAFGGFFFVTAAIIIR